MAQNWQKIELDWVNFNSIFPSSHVTVTASHARTLTISRAIHRDDVMLETLTFLLSHISQTFQIKENRIFKQKTREKDISYRDRVRQLPRRKVEYISSWRETGRLVLLFTFSFLTASHCPHYTWSMFSTSTYEVWLPGHAIMGVYWPTLLPPCARLSDWHPTLASLGPKPSPCRSRGRDIFPGSRLGSSLHSRTFLQSEICRDGPWSRVKMVIRAGLRLPVQTGYR